jgi:hypothetical protein
MTQISSLLNKFLLASIFFISCSQFLVLAQTLSPSHILMCESTDDACNRPGAHLDITWTFDGTDGTVSGSDSQADMHLTIEKLDADSIEVRGAVQSGPRAGLTASYSGAIHGNSISGTVNWSWPGHPDYPAKGFFLALLPDQSNQTVSTPSTPATSANPPTPAPSELLVCENNGPCNAAWTFKGDTGTGTWFSRNPTRAKLTILRLEADYIVIRRTDVTDGISANYAGSLRGDHYSGTIIWNGPARPGQQAGTWTATVPQTVCPEQAGLEAADAMLTGQYALMFKRNQDALSCYLVAASAGDSTAQAAVGLLYYQGNGEVAQNYEKAFFWLHKAADQGVYAAQRTVAEMYTAGLGTRRDATLAGIYTARADEQKHDLEGRQDLEEKELDRRNQVLSNFVLGASFGLFF